MAENATGDFLKDALRDTRKGYAAAIFFSLSINLLAFVSPIYMMQIYDRVITSRNAVTLLVLTAIAAFLLIVYAFLEKLRSSVLVRVGMLFAGKSRVPLFNAVLRASLIQPSTDHNQSLRDLDTVREFLTGSGFLAFCDAPWIPIFVAGCFLLHPWYGAVALAGAILILAFALANEVLTRRHLQPALVNVLAAASYASATFRNAEVLHAMGMLPGLRDRWAAQQDCGLRLQARASDRAGYLVAGSKFVRAFLQVAILGVGAYLTIEQDSTPGAMMAASIIMGRALAPVEIAVANWRNFIAARSAYERITALFRTAPEDPPRMKLPPPSGSISVENLVVVPPGSKMPALRGVSFALEPGEALGILGPSAAGKSTLARALVGVWPPGVGTVRIDGAELSHWNPEQLGQHIGYLPQDVELFSGTVAENISRFGPQTEADIIAAAKMAGVHEMVQRLPAGYNTQIGQNGFVLSGGQRQRIGLARAMYRAPKFIVLDEPNASLDNEGEVALASALQEMRQRGSTLVLITHRINVLSKLDKILILSSGKTQLFGAREQVLAQVVGPRLSTVSNVALAAG